MRIRSFLLALAAGFVLPLSAASAVETPPAVEVEAVVDIPTQTMVVSVNNVPIDQPWPVSTSRAPTARTNYHTPTGVFAVQRMDATHHSKWFHHASMPFSVFFDDRRAIHATTGGEDADLGTPVSHGCVRTSLQHAEIFFNLVQHYGKGNTVITIK